MTKNSVPYASATSAENARKDIKKILIRFGCEEIGFMDNFEKHEVLLHFKHRGRTIQLPASAKGWAQLYLQQTAWTSNRRTPRIDYEQAALQEGRVAVNSILRDWIKGQMTAVESGILSFEAVFMPYTLTADGRTVLDRLAEIDLLPAPAEQKILPLKPTA